VNGVLSYSEAAEGTPELLYEANEALNEHIRLQRPKKGIKRGR